ncbi:MAG: carboxypeptidase-like regulatory domain-containing protein [Acidobacteriota bacterium]|nr:carboxypeptidase-like regulatory domain-containing protein [Acidobacteriota bacterium]
MKYLDNAIVILSFLLLRASWALASPQASTPPPPATGIFGRVVNATTHEPVRRAIVKVYTSRDQWDEFTDGEGRFRFPDLARDEYTLIAHRDGYTDSSYTVERSDFDVHKELPVELRPQAVITGRVVDRFGQALPSAQIQALAPRTRGGKLEVMGSAETNDLGEYRLASLNPATYRLRADYREGRANEYDPTPLTQVSSYYGGAEKPAEIAVKAGSLITGINFILNPVRPFTIRGTLQAESGILTESVSMWITGHAGEGGHSGTGRDGKFEIGDLGPGAYTIHARTSDKTTPLFGNATVEVRNSDVDALTLVLRPIPKVDGEVRVEGDASTDLKLRSIIFVPTDQDALLNMQMADPDKDRRFTVALIPGEYLFSFNPAIAGVDVQRVTLDGKPATNGKLLIDGSPEAKKLVIILGPKARP